MRRREKTPKPIISAPMGPIKNSRGADLIRSERLQMVDTLKDCESSTSLLEEQAHSPSTITSRKLSAGFSNTGPLSSTSTVASSQVTATPMIQYPSRIHQQLSPQKRRKSLLGGTSSIPKPLQAGPPTKYAFSSARAGKAGALTLEENVPLRPLDDVGASMQQQQKPTGTSRLPKSRTMNALHELKSSISRPSLSIRSVNALGHHTTTTSYKGSSSSSSPSSITSPLLPAAAYRLRAPSHASVSSYIGSTASPTGGQELRGSIDCAKPSAYWCGRFIALRDRLLAESFSADLSNSTLTVDSPDTTSPPPETPYSSLYRRTAHLPHSTTLSALRNVPSNLTAPAIPEDDLLCRRVFAQLNCLCVTTEARRSLYAWQQAYARQQGRACLLPKGGSMENRSIMSKIFGNGPAHRGERLSLHSLREAAADRMGKRTTSEGCSAASSHTKRLTVF